MTTGEERMPKDAVRESRATAIENTLASLGASVGSLEAFLNDANGDASGEDSKPDPCRPIIALIEQLPENLSSLKDRINSSVVKCREAFL